ncbi:MAG: relaxase domain-containing protein, partial [Cyanobacteria bacterium J06597_1]
MLTTKTVPPSAKNYYKEDNYYSKEDSEAQSQWQGKGAEKLGLSGTVDDEIFGLLLHGRLPDKTNFGQQTDGFGSTECQIQGSPFFVVVLGWGTMTKFG